MIKDSKCSALTVLVFLCAVATTNQFSLNFDNNDKTVMDTLMTTLDFDQIYSLIERNPIVNSTMHLRSVTVFAPLNTAFMSKKDNDDDYLPYYHITNAPYKLEQLERSVSSELEGNPPIWITKKGPEEYYANQARIIHRLSNYEHNNEKGKPQVLHVIDQVLQPLRLKKDMTTTTYNPNASKMMEINEILDLDGYRINAFRNRVIELQKLHQFGNKGGHTFFIPVDEVNNYQRANFDIIDKQIIDAHIIPDNVLFLGPTNEGEQFKTLAFTDMLRVVAFFSSNEDAGRTKHYVSSDTIFGGGSYPTGAVTAEIIKANIPIENGVVHLISKPLMLVDKTVKQFVESYKDRDDGILHRFFEAIVDSAGSSFMDKLEALPNITLFAPSNAAFNDPLIEPYLTNRTFIRYLLDMHLVNQRLSMDDIISGSVDKVPTEVPLKDLFFNVVISGKNRTLTLEGGSVNATAIQPNLAAKNGIIHIIDRVLGIPSSTVDRKLATDPTLNFTNYLGSASGLNDELSNTEKRFTYFVPRNWAWNHVNTHSPHVFNKIFDNVQVGRQILERHLIVSNKAYTMEDLRALATNSNLSVKLSTVRDVNMYLQVKQVMSGYMIGWRDEWINVYRPDVHCTNGIIHVIDKVLMEDSDVNTGTMITSATTLLMIVLVHSITLYYFN
ncbi:fasciclin-1 isoform X2 [Daktulosphaira vitifoliae]|uniref:fasciclin-1 isoform X2 n=1 Tax=Daktulosphaira vitifoliae TaxID=58002 RepID=UPI0021AA1ACF|nr:fasciclin-1 isoform X2 [Daktulosphaira vitifoliae]